MKIGEIGQESKFDYLRKEGSIQRIAESYVESVNEIGHIPTHEKIKIHGLIALQFADLSKNSIYFNFIQDEPYNYTTVDDMREDYHKGFISVNTTGNNSDFWGECYNLMFRAIHDYFHADRILHFTYEDEIKAYQHQVLHSYEVAISNGMAKTIDWELYYQILRSEIIYQAAYKTHFKEFHLPEQKIILSQL